MSPNSGNNGTALNDRTYPFVDTNLFFPNYSDPYFLTLYRDNREDLQCKDFYGASPQDYVGRLGG